MKTAIITGISGQDGSYLAKLLLKKNYDVIGLIREDQDSEISNLKYLDIENKLTLKRVDCLNKEKIEELIKEEKPKEIYNLAAQSSVGMSFIKPVETFDFNTKSVCNILEAIRIYSPSTKLYQASSSEMYGSVKNLPISLNTPMHPVSPYAVSKMAAHYMIINYRETYNLFATNGILFNHESYLRKNNFFIKKVIRESIAIKMGFLKHLTVGNLNLKRDFGFAPCYVEAMWRMMQTNKPEDFIICSGTSILLKDIVDYIFEKLSINKQLIVIDKNLFRPNDILNIYGDNSKAKKELSWSYEMSFYKVIDLLIEEEYNNLYLKN